MHVTIYHNPRCGTSRNTLALIREAGIEPIVIDYLKTPPGRTQLVALIAATGQPVRDIVRQKEALYAELALDAASDDTLIDAMVAHPVLMNRPIVVVDGTARLCRPAEQVLPMLAILAQL
ncbi:MAG: arsenate reductase (glutaredoxin) [Pseudomonadota bacterium]|nr:arsenate reductase (glutaredoxin) [Pseudomonadota bacterium]